LALPDVATSIFGRYEFLIRRLHSLTGLVPLGGYLIFHLATNAAIIDGIETYQHRADQIHRLGPTTILILEWLLIFIPLIFHSLIGLLIVMRGKRNVVDYAYEGNIRYTLQRWTGVIAFVFIFWHVFHMHGWLRFEWWRTAIVPWAGGLFDPEDAATAAQAIQAAWWVPVLYAIGVVSVVYHFANGLWTMGITWGLWVSPRAQEKAKAPIAVIGALVMFLGLGSLAAMMMADVPHDPDAAIQRQEHAWTQPHSETATSPVTPTVLSTEY
jgi:succinate dehydrogenase / fumarate reductase cytochrome b subunit